jgi:hypothetical protein
MSAAAAAAPAAAAAAPAEEAKALKMKYAPLGRSGLRVSELCLGAMTFGLRAGTTSLGLQNIGEEESLRVLDRFVEMGGNFIDTADGYTDTESEQLLGRWLAAKPAGFRQRVVIATKVFFPRSDDPNDRGLSRKHILENVDKSLQRLQTSYIDLYIVHCWDEGAPLEETLRALNDLVVAGKVRYLGCSNFWWAPPRPPRRARRPALTRADPRAPQRLAAAEGAHAARAARLGALHRPAAAVQPPLPLSVAAPRRAAAAAPPPPPLTLRAQRPSGSCLTCASARAWASRPGRRWPAGG